MAWRGSMRSRISSLTPIGPQPAPEMPDAKPGHQADAADPRPGTRRSVGSTLPRPPQWSVASTTHADDHDERRDQAGDDVLGQRRGEERPDERADHAADDERQRDVPGDVAQPVVRARAERDDQHLEEQRRGRREARVDAQQQQARHEHAAVDADGRRGRARPRSPRASPRRSIQRSSAGATTSVTRITSDAHRRASRPTPRTPVGVMPIRWPQRCWRGGDRRPRRRLGGRRARGRASVMRRHRPAADGLGRVGPVYYARSEFSDVLYRRTREPLPARRRRTCRPHRHVDPA